MSRTRARLHERISTGIVAQSLTLGKESHSAGWEDGSAAQRVQPTNKKTRRPSSVIRLP